MRRTMAFTMIELLVAMVLSSIVVTFAYSLFSSTEFSFQKTFNQYGKTNELLQLQVILNQDCRNARQVSFENERITVECNDHSRIIYTITNDRIIREVGPNVDTFLLDTFQTSIQYLFNSPPLLEKLIIEVHTEKTSYFILTAQVFYTNQVKFEYNQLININK